MAAPRAPWTQVWGALLLVCCSGVDLASANRFADDAWLSPSQGQLGQTEAHPVSPGEGEAKPLPGGEVLLQVKRRTISTRALSQAVAEERAAEDGHFNRERKLLADIGRLEWEYEASKATESLLQEKLDRELARVQALSAERELALKAELAAQGRAQRMRLLATGGLVCAAFLAMWVQQQLQAWLAGKWRAGATGGAPLRAALWGAHPAQDEDADVEAGPFAAASPDTRREGSKESAPAPAPASADGAAEGPEACEDAPRQSSSAAPPPFASSPGEHVANI